MAVGEEAGDFGDGGAELGCGLEGEGGEVELGGGARGFAYTGGLAQTSTMGYWNLVPAILVCEDNG